MGVINCINLNGTTVGEETVGAGRIDYAMDALGSVTGTLAGSTLQNIYAYKPYGGQLSKIGPAPDPAFTWVGSRGYRATERQFSEVYVRARTYSITVSRWITRDPLWPSQRSYTYPTVPTHLTDPSGPQTYLDIFDECLGVVTHKQGLCQRNAYDKFSADTIQCQGLPNPDFALCAAPAMAQYVIEIAACRAREAWRFEICQMEFEACIAGSKAARAA
jgi:RHS repeat-associated protein